MENKKPKKELGDLFHFKSIQSTMIFSFGILVVLSLCTFMMISLNFTEETVLENSKDYTMQLIEQLNSEIDSYIAYVENISQMVSASENSDVINYLFNDHSDDGVLRERVLNQFKVVQETRNDILNIAVIAENGKSLIDADGAKLNPYIKLEDSTWYQNMIKAGGDTVVSPSHVQNIIEGTYNWVITVGKGLVNPNTGRIEGVFFINLNYSSIRILCEKINLGDKGYLFIVDKNGSIIYHPKQKLLLAGLKTEYINRVLEQKRGSFATKEGGQSKIYTVATSKETGWTVAGVSNIDELMKNKDRTQVAYITIASFLLIFAVILAVLISRAMTKPIMKLKRVMEEVEKDNFKNIKFTVKGNNEIASLGKSFNVMTDKIQKLMEENTWEQEEKRKNELKALQSQINPHFLYNTLDSIIWMAESGKDQEVVLMTSALGKLLRQSISNEAEKVPIETEISYTRSYLTIQKMRYKDQLEYEIDIDEDILKKEIVKLVIQPLVENSIYHGIKYLDAKGMIWITGGIVGDDIVLSVRDNGVGIGKDTITKIFEGEMEENSEGRNRNHVGIYNVHNRLQLHYGKKYGLSYRSAPGLGTTVFITIPNQEE